MANDRTSPSHSDNIPLRKPSPQGRSLTGSESIVNISYEDRSQLHLPSHSPSPKLTSILLPPSDSGASRPQSAESRVTSLSISNHSRHPSRSQRSISGTLKRRGTIPNADMGERRMEPHTADTKEDALLNFGLEDPIVFQLEDPQVLDDVQRALEAKALRESRPADDDGSVPPLLANSNNDPEAISNSNPLVLPLSAASGSCTPSRPVIAVSTHSLTSSDPTKIEFPTYNPSASRSVESIASQEHFGRAPIPTLVTHPNGSGYLDWSGNTSTLDILEEKDKSILRRTLSLTKRKPKPPKDHIRNFSGRKSLDIKGSSGDLHTAMLDSLRRTARRDLLSRADVTKHELGRHYAFLTPRKPTGEPMLNILDVVRWRPHDVAVEAPWLSWCRQTNVNEEKAYNCWSITADIIEEYLRSTGQAPIAPKFPFTTRPRSPYRFPSPLSSPHSSPSKNPFVHDSSSHREQHNNQPLFTSPSIEGVVVSSNDLLSPMTSRSLNVVQPPPLESRHSSNAVMGAESQVTDAVSSPGSSMEEERLQLSYLTKEKDLPVKQKAPPALRIDRTMTTPDSVGASTPILVQPYSKNGTSTSSSHRLHLGVGAVLDKLRRSSDEIAVSINRKNNSRSSISGDDQDHSAKEGQRTKKSDPALDQRKEKGARFRAGFELKSLRPIAKDTWNTSESETGLLTATAGQHSKHSDTNRGDDGIREDVPESISSGGPKGIDALAGPGWTSRRGVMRARISVPQEQDKETLRDMFHRLEEEEERAQEVYRSRELLLVEANDHNRKIARMLKAIGSSIREYEKVQAEFAQVVGLEHTSMPPEVLEAISSDPATTLRHGKGWRAVEHSHNLYHSQQGILSSYLTSLTGKPDQPLPPSLSELIEVSRQLWQGLKVRSQQIEHQAMMVKPALKRAATHMESVQKEYNSTQILVETGYPEQSQIFDLENAILESREPRGWLEFAAVWIPEHVLELVGGFIRFFGVSISEKFIRPILWYFFRNQYYWKIYSTEPPPNERAWYTRLAYWIVVISILAWFVTPP